MHWPQCQCSGVLSPTSVLLQNLSKRSSYPNHSHYSWFAPSQLFQWNPCVLSWLIVSHLWLYPGCEEFDFSPNRHLIHYYLLTYLLTLIAPTYLLQECHHNVIQYEFPSADLSLSTIFGQMEEACRDLHIEDYSISQNTLDNVRLFTWYLSPQNAQWLPTFSCNINAIVTPKCEGGHLSLHIRKFSRTIKLLICARN